MVSTNWDESQSIYSWYLQADTYNRHLQWHLFAEPLPLGNLCVCTKPIVFARSLPLPDSWRFVVKLYHKRMLETFWMLHGVRYYIYSFTADLPHYQLHTVQALKSLQLAPTSMTLACIMMCLASFPGLWYFQLHEERGGPGIFPHVHDVKGRNY